MRRINSVVRQFEDTICEERRWGMNLFVAALVIILSPVFSIIGGQSSANSSTQTIVGTWRLIIYEDHPDHRPIEYPFGKNPVGLLIYDKTGHLAIQIMKTPHPKVASGDDEKITSEEKIALLDSYVAYFGTYSVDWKRHIVTHKVEADLYDVFVGTTQERPFELKGNRLTLSPSWTREGKVVKGLRVFERVK